MHPKQITSRMMHKFIILTQVGLMVRFIFSLVDADKTNSFVQWIYTMTETLLMPFRGIFPAESFENSYVLEYRVLFAMAAYSVVAYMVMAAMHVLPTPKFEGIDWEKVKKWDSRRR